MSRAWVRESIHRIERDFQRSADTHLVPVELAAMPDVRLYLKDESTHPTGSLKHRLARSLFLYGLCNGWIAEGSTVVEASSGSTAVSEAYFARMLGLPFVAVMPRGTSPAKIAQIEFYGGRCHFVDQAGEVYAEAERLARERRRALHGPVHLRRARDRLARQQQHRRVDLRADARRAASRCRAGSSSARGRAAPRRRSGATSASRAPRRACAVVDPERSVFCDYYANGDPTVTAEGGSDVEGIGRPRVEPSFVPGVIDRMIRVPNAASYAAMRVLERLVGRRYGGSTGTNFCGALEIACEMAARGEAGAIVTLACDAGDRYLDTYYSDAWLAAGGYDVAPHVERFERACATGRWTPA